MTTETDTTDVDEAEEKQKLNLEVQVKEPSACQRHVTVTVSKDDVNRYFDEAFSEMMPKASVPGFRSGRAPRKLVESKFRSEVEDQVKGSLLMDSMTQITEENDFSAISEPDFDFEAIELPEDGPLTFEFDLEVRPEFETPNWKGLELERPTREFSAGDIDQHLEEMLSAQGALTPREDAVEERDYIVANVTFTHEDTEVSLMEEQTIRALPVLSFADGLIEGFDKLVVGAKAGEKISTKVTVSHDAPNEDLQGKDVDVEFDILEVKRLELPELDEDMLSRFGDFGSEGDFRDALKGDLERRLSYQQQQRIRSQITKVLTESADWDLPPDLLQRQSRREQERAIMELRSAGYRDEEIRAYENELRQNSKESTKRALHEHFILERIADDEELEADPDDYDSEIMLLAAQSSEPPRRVRARIEKRGQMDALRNQIVERKVIDLITEQAKFKDVDFDLNRNKTEAVNHFICGQSEEQIPEAKHDDDATVKQPADRS